MTLSIGTGPYGVTHESLVKAMGGIFPGDYSIIVGNNKEESMKTYISDIPENASEEFKEYATNLDVAYKKLVNIRTQHQAIINEAEDEYEATEKELWNKYMGR